MGGAKAEKGRLQENRFQPLLHGVGDAANQGLVPKVVGRSRTEVSSPVPRGRGNRGLKRIIAPHGTTGSPGEPEDLDNQDDDPHGHAQ